MRREKQKTLLANRPDTLKLEEVEIRFSNTSIVPEDVAGSVVAEMQGERPLGPESTGGGMALMEVSRGSAPLSLWDWRIWTQARLTFWRYGDAAKLFLERETQLLTQEWMECMCNLEELEYANRYRALQRMLAWTRFPAERVRGQLAHHASLRHVLPLIGAETIRVCVLEERWDQVDNEGSQSHRGDACSRRPRGAAERHPGFGAEPDALNAIQAATANVIGTDGHHRLCRHEGHAYMSLFDPPVVFMTPNLADTTQPLLLVVQGLEIRLDAATEVGVELPKQLQGHDAACSARPSETDAHV